LHVKVLARDKCAKRLSHILFVVLRFLLHRFDFCDGLQKKASTASDVAISIPAHPL